MKINFDTEKRCFYFSLSDFKDFFHEMDTDSQQDLIKCFGWSEGALKEAVRILSEEFSRENYNDFIHNHREKILENIKQEEIKYYADKISAKIEKLYREGKDYWELYNYAKTKLEIPGDFNPPQKNLINFDLKNQLAEIIKEAFKLKWKEMK